MTPATPGADLAARVADHLHAPSPWEVVAERSRRFEVHVQGTTIELERGPITVEGYGVRVLRKRGEGVGTGFVASTDFSAKGVESTLKAAETTSEFTEFPAKSVDLPAGAQHAPDVAIVDPQIWSDPAAAVRRYVESLLAAFEGRRGVVPSFGSVKAVLSEISVANSAGLRVSFPSTQAELELAVKAFGGPEGAPPGEFWVTDAMRRLAPDSIRSAVDDWCRYAADVRRAKSPPSGDLAVLLPPDVLMGIVPPVFAGRFTGAGRLRKVAPGVGEVVAAERVTVQDGGDFPWSPGSAPYDGEGTASSRHTLIDKGKVAGLLYDTLYGAAFDTRSTGNATRRALGGADGLLFASAPHPGTSTVVMPPGDGGSVDELAETAGEGVLVTQLGWARPDPISSMFGGEIRIGYRIHHGKVAEPVRGGTVGGVVLAPAGAPSLLAGIQAIGSRQQLSDRMAAPPVLVRSLTVAGA